MNINQAMLESARAKQLAKEEAEKRKQANNDMRVKNASGVERREMKRDFDAGAALGKEILGTGLGRIKDDADVRASKDLMRTRAQEGLSDKEENAMREKGLNNIQGAEKKASRTLSASLARSGVRGGAAGQMQVELAAQNVQNRRSFETDLLLNDEATKRKAELDFANFSTKLQEFDLGQAAKEKNIILQTQLATAQMGSTARGATKNAIAQEEAAKAKKGGCFPVGTMVTMEDGSEKHIESLKIGDVTKLGGEVTGLHTFKCNETIYLIEGVFMTGSHGIKEEGRWVRARDSKYGIATNIKPKRVYCASTENHLLSISHLTLLDYEETDYDLSEADALIHLNEELKKAV